MNDEKSFTLSQAAEILGISIPTIRRLVSTGRLKAEKQLVGDRLCWRVHKEEVVRFQSERKDQVGEHREQRKARRVNDERVSEQGAELVPLVAHLDLVRVLEETQLRLLDVTERAHRAERQSDLMRMELMATRNCLTEQAESLFEKQAIVKQKEEILNESQRKQSEWEQERVKLEAENAARLIEFEQEKQQWISELETAKSRVNWMEQRVPRWVRSLFKAV
jgi:excisionase family DNA binding protein